MSAHARSSLNVASSSTRRLSALLAFAALAVACTPRSPSAGDARARAPAAATSQRGATLVPADPDAKVALGLMYKSGAELYSALKTKAGGGAPLSLDDMPDWTGFWQRVGPP